MGLNAILSISIPILNAIYPLCIVLIILGLSDKLWSNNCYVYPFVIIGTGFVSVIYAMDAAGIPLEFLSDLCQMLPLYAQGFCWISVAVVMWGISLLINFFRKTT